jgi:hypothetical protein
MSTAIPSTSQTRAFLKLLDPNATTFHFRTFADARVSNRTDLTGNFSGTIDRVEGNLLSRNEAGAGVFAVINEGGQKKDDICRIRAVFADTDGAPLEPIEQALKPHAVIQSSPGNYHVYWLVKDDFPLDMFTPVQVAIATKFETDTKVKDLPRVMRLPGFKHNKNDPVDVVFTNWDAALARYSFLEIVNGLGFGLDDFTPVDEPVASPLLKALHSNPYSLVDVEEMLRYVDPAQGRDKWMPICFALAGEYGEDARDLFIRWSRGDLGEVLGQ